MVRAFLAREHQLSPTLSHNVVDERFRDLLFGCSSQISQWIHIIPKNRRIQHSNCVGAKQLKGNKTGGSSEDFCDEHRKQLKDGRSKECFLSVLLAVLLESR